MYKMNADTLYTWYPDGRSYIDYECRHIPKCYRFEDSRLFLDGYRSQYWCKLSEGSQRALIKSGIVPRTMKVSWNKKPHKDFISYEPTVERSKISYKSSRFCLHNPKCSSFPGLANGDRGYWCQLSKEAQSSLRNQ